MRGTPSLESLLLHDLQERRPAEMVGYLALGELLTQGNPPRRPEQTDDDRIIDSLRLRGVSVDWNSSRHPVKDVLTFTKQTSSRVAYEKHRERVIF